MAVASLANLKPFKARSFIPVKANLGEWKQIEPIFAQLEESIGQAKTQKALLKWVDNVSEFGAAIDQEAARRYINMTCQTDDAEAKKAFMHFVEEIDPKCKPRWFKLKQLFLANPLHKKLPAKRWMVFLRAMKNEVQLFKPENVPLQVEESKLEQKYQETMAAMTVKFQGKEQTLQQLTRYLEEPDRKLRQEVWQLIAKRRLQDKEKIEHIYDELLTLRGKVAENAGLASYREYAFKAKNRFDYTPKECKDFHDAVAELVVPLAREQQKRRASLLGVDTLHPWDLGVDVKNRAPLKPFSDAEMLVSKCQSIFNKLDKTLGKHYDLMRKHKLLDLDSRKGKAPGGYQYSLEEARLPFIFMNAVGLHRDVETMLHEAGHAFHALAARDEEILSYRSAPLEFCEVASMSMELLGAPHLTEFYSVADAARARRTHLEGIIGLLPWIAIIDAFQHWIYTHPGHSHQDRQAHWLGLLDRFGGIESYSGFEAARASMWHRQGHLFGSPFYYIEYGIAQLGALQLWLNSKKSVSGALNSYRKALALGGSRPLPELFKTARIKFDFGPKTVKPLVKAVQKELKELDNA